MNIIEALKTGRPFKRKFERLLYPAKADHRFTTEDILADDWEVQPEILEISRDEWFASVAAWAKKEFTQHRMWYASEKQYVDCILSGALSLW